LDESQVPRLEENVVQNIDENNPNEINKPPPMNPKDQNFYEFFAYAHLIMIILL
jgi:hypothetical protein